MGNSSTFVDGLVKAIEESNRPGGVRRILPEREWDSLTKEEKFYDSLGQLAEARDKGLVKSRSDGPALTGRLVDIVNRSRVAQATPNAARTKAAGGSLLDIVMGSAVAKKTKDLTRGNA